LKQPTTTEVVNYEKYEQSGGSGILLGQLILIETAYNNIRW
jgi:hypothetical protein